MQPAPDEVVAKTVEAFKSIDSDYIIMAVQRVSRRSSSCPQRERG